MAVSASNVDLKERVCHLTNKIYREMLCITRYGRSTYIIMGGLGLDRIQVNALSLIPQYSTQIILSEDLLFWMTFECRILCSFTNFITTIELSGPLYISPDIYHTQITEYSLETIHRWDFFLSAIEYLPNFYSVGLYSGFSPGSFGRNWIFKEHISRALPTVTIFYLLRSIRSKILIPDCSKAMWLDTLDIIIKWLQVSVIVNATDKKNPCRLKNPICV